MVLKKKVLNNDKFNELHNKVEEFHNRYKKKTNVKKTNFTNYYNKAVKIYSKEEILINIHILLLFLNEIVGNPEDVTIIGIGDSPAILLQIYKKFIPKINLFFLPISEINPKNTKLLAEKLNGLDTKIKTDKIIWVDYVSSGKSIVTILNSVKKTVLRKKSIFFGYGQTYNYIFQKIRNKNNVKLFYVHPESFFYSYLRSLLGNSEAYQIRCIKRTLFDNNYKAKLVSVRSLPNNTTTSKYCVNYAQFLFEEMKSIGLFIK